MSSATGISIIVPTYNESNTVKVLLEQIFSLKQDITFELIIVDANNSTDNLKEITSCFPIYYIKSSSTNRAKQLNEGASFAKYNILYFLHADAIPPKDFLESILASINNGFDFGYFRYQFDSKKILLKINSYFSQYNTFYTGGGDQSCYIKKFVFENIGGFNEELHLCEDFDLLDRLKEKKYKFEVINSKLIISSRKYQSNGYLKVNLINLYTLWKFKKGEDTKILKEYYLKKLG